MRTIDSSFVAKHEYLHLCLKNMKMYLIPDLVVLFRYPKVLDRLRSFIFIFMRTKRIFSVVKMH